MADMKKVNDDLTIINLYNKQILDDFPLVFKILQKIIQPIITRALATLVILPHIPFLTQQKVCLDFYFYHK